MRNKTETWYFACPQMDYIYEVAVIRVEGDYLITEVDANDEWTCRTLRVCGCNEYYPTRKEAVDHLEAYWTEEIMRIEQEAIAAVGVAKDKLQQIGRPVK